MNDRVREVPTVRHHVSSDRDSIHELVAEIVASRDLFQLLIRRELQVRYRQTVLGVLWVILQPVIPAIILAIVLGQFARLPSAGVPYVLYALSGLTLFGLFSGVATRAGGSLLSDARLVTKVYFPRSLLPLASGTAAVVDFLVGLLVLVVAIIGFGRLPGAAIVFVPVIVSLTFFAAMAIGLAIAGLSAYYRDFAYVVPFVLQVLLYASPVVYAYELVPAPFRLLFSLNPLVPLIQGFRAAVLGTPPPTLLEAAVGLIVICVMALLGVATFERTSRNLTDVI